MRRPAAADIGSRLLVRSAKRSEGRPVSRKTTVRSLARMASQQGWVMRKKAQFELFAQVTDKEENKEQNRNTILLHILCFMNISDLLASHGRWKDSSIPYLLQLSLYSKPRLLRANQSRCNQHMWWQTKQPPALLSPAVSTVLPAVSQVSPRIQVSPPPVHPALKPLGISTILYGLCKCCK